MKTTYGYIKHLALLSALATSLMFLSCSGDECTLNCNGELRYPMAVGYSWQFSRTDLITNFRPDNDSVGNVLTDSLDEYILTITIDGMDTLTDNTVIYSWHEVLSIGDSLVQESYQYYGNKVEGLYHYTTLSSPGTDLLNFKSTTASELQQSLAEPGRKSLEYPLAEGLQWEYTNGFDYGVAGAIYKEIIGIGEQSVPAGKFECYAIGWLWQNLPNIERTEYLCDVGLVRVKEVVRDVEIKDYYAHANGVDGVADMVMELRLLQSPF